MSSPTPRATPEQRRRAREMRPSLFEADIRANARYEVLTWDNERDGWTPQKGVRRGPYRLWGLRRALRKLWDMGYCELSSRGGSVQVSRLAPKGAP